MNAQVTGGVVSAAVTNGRKCSRWRENRQTSKSVRKNGIGKSRKPFSFESYGRTKEDHLTGNSNAFTVSYARSQWAEITVRTKTIVITRWNENEKRSCVREKVLRWKSDPVRFIVVHVWNIKFPRARPPSTDLGGGNIEITCRPLENITPSLLCARDRFGTVKSSVFPAVSDIYLCKRPGAPVASTARLIRSENKSSK